MEQGQFETNVLPLNSRMATRPATRPEASSKLPRLDATLTVPARPRVVTTGTVTTSKQIPQLNALLEGCPREAQLKVKIAAAFKAGGTVTLNREAKKITLTSTIGLTTTTEFVSW